MQLAHSAHVALTLTSAQHPYGDGVRGDDPQAFGGGQRRLGINVLGGVLRLGGGGGHGLDGNDRHRLVSALGATVSDVTAYITATPREAGWHDVSVSATWTPRVGSAITVTGGYLDANSPNGTVFLGCGVEELASDLGMLDAVDGHELAICELVNAQLLRQPWAVVTCAFGTLRLELLRCG